LLNAILRVTSKARQVMVNASGNIPNNNMSEVQFFSIQKPQRLTSLEEDFKAWRKEFLEGEKQNALKSQAS
jgi:hypothetical protein